MSSRGALRIGPRRARLAGVAGVAPVATVLALAALPVHAHSRSVSYSSWTFDGSEARVVLRVSQLELTRLPWGAAFGDVLDPQLARYMRSRLTLSRGGVRCTPSGTTRKLGGASDRASVEWRLHCSRPGAVVIRSDFMLEVAPSHLHFARVRLGDGPPLERLLTDSSRSWTLEPPESAGAPGRAPTSGGPRGSSLQEYLRVGIEHIWSGYDHLAFVLALILIAARLRDVTLVVTGFTVGHSVTLALAALGWAEPDRAAIEALIGLSIALVAIENAWLEAARPRWLPGLLIGALATFSGLALLGVGRLPALTLLGVTLFSACYFGLVSRASRPERLRIAIACAFGLVHGFGFAGVLIEVGLPRERLIPALLGFNLGVEVGQLAVVATLWPLLRALARLGAGRAHRLGVELGSAALCGLGLFWFIERGFGG